MKACAIITGASKGFGACLALQMSISLQSVCDLDLYLLARSESGLRKTERSVLESWKSGVYKLNVRLVVVDLSNLQQMEPILERMWCTVHEQEYQCSYLFHNAGSIGELCYTQEWPSLRNLAAYNDFNLTSMMWITKRYLDLFGANRIDQIINEDLSEDVPLYAGRDQVENTTGKSIEAKQKYSHVIVNVSSLCAMCPFHCMSMYCVAKAGRHMQIRTVAVEQSHSNKVGSLSYSPGPMDTDMQVQCRSNPMNYAGSLSLFRKMKSDGKLVDPVLSAKECIELILKNEFKSGDHIDYFDIRKVG